MVCGSMIFREFLDAVYAPQHLGISAGTLGQYRIAITLFDRWHGQPVLLSDLSDDLLLRFLHQYSQSVSMATVNGKRRFLLAVWRFAAEKGLCSGPGKIPRAKEHPALPEAWKKDDVELIFAVSRSLSGTIAEHPARHWWTSLLLVIFDTGGRIGAVRKVRTEDYGSRSTRLPATSGRAGRFVRQRRVASRLNHFDGLVLALLAGAIYFSLLRAALQQLPDRINHL